MAMVLQVGLIVLLALAALVTTVLVVAVRRLGLLRWRPAHSHSVVREEIPATVRDILDRPAAELVQLGFVYRYSGAVQPMLVTPQNAPTFFDMYQHGDGHTHAMVSPSHAPEPQQPCMLQLITCFDDGSNWLTLNRCRHLSPIDLPRWQTTDDYLPQWVQAWHRHQERVQTATVPVCSDGVEVHKRLRQTFEDLLPHMRKQGQLVPVAGDSGHFRLTLLAATHMALKVLVGQLRAGWSAPPKPGPTPEVGATPPTPQHNSLDADLRAFQDQLANSRAATSSAKSKWMTFIVTAVLFLLVGGLWLSWTFVPIVLAVVALHEGGHYLAMKLTGFRNVSVFFVPGLGGLATGEKATATPFEKLFVYLAGPVPGITLAGAAFWASASGYWTGPDWLNEFLIASLVINYLNLLPLMPLDGGRVLETLVFARHPRLRFAFAAICCAALFGLGQLFDDMVLRVVAVLIAFGLPYQWRRMQLDQAVPRDSNAALDEPQALQRIFGALQQAKFQSWSFAKRTAAATALLPEMLGRRASHWEAFVGVVIYAACLFAPLGAAFVAIPHLGSALAILTPGLRVPPDDVEADPARAPLTEPPDWSAKLAQAEALPPDQRLAAYTGAAQQAHDSEDTDNAYRHYQDAWTLAQALPPRDPRRISVLHGLASVVDDETERRGYLNQVVAELAQPTGPEREQVAQAKEYLAFGDITSAERVALLRDALDLRVGTSPDDPNFTVASTRLALARALDAHGDSTGAQAQLQTRIDNLPLPEVQDRSRRALDQRLQRVMARVDLAWFLMAHGHTQQAQQTATLALVDLPATVTVSWLQPQQQALEAQVWSLLLSPQPATPLATAWKTYDNARSAGFGGDRKLLFHEVDRALVAQALNDERLLNKAKSGIAEALSKMSRPGTALCKPPLSGTHANWRAPQQAARQRMLTELGHCRTV
nr:site-2 protease family protein [uncultured Rhodoferax sp.]